MKTLPLELTALTKQYGTERGIEDVHLTVQEGEIFGFLGPNGAGKTTAIRTIMNFLHPTSGSASVRGFDSARDDVAVKQHVGYLAGDFEMYDTLTGEQYLTFIAHLRGVENAETIIAELAEQLEANLTKKIGTLSRGNTQKIALIAALLHDPDVLILDEPTTGLDPLMQNRFYDIITTRAKRGKTVFMSSHILSEVQAVCDRVAFMRQGKVIEVIDIKKAQKNRKKQVRLMHQKGTKPMQLPSFKDLEVQKHTVKELCFTTSADSKELLRWLSVQPVADVTIQTVSLEDVFLRLYGSHEGLAHVS